MCDVRRHIVTCDKSGITSQPAVLSDVSQSLQSLFELTSWRADHRPRLQGRARDGECDLLGTLVVSIISATGSGLIYAFDFTRILYFFVYICNDFLNETLSHVQNIKIFMSNLLGYLKCFLVLTVLTALCTFSSG